MRMIESGAEMVSEDEKIITVEQALVVWIKLFYGLRPAMPRYIFHLFGSYTSDYSHRIWRLIVFV